MISQDFFLIHFSLCNILPLPKPLVVPHRISKRIRESWAKLFIMLLERLLNYIKKFLRVWFATAEEIARYWMDRKPN
jgi:hypothetical protein